MGRRRPAADKDHCVVVLSCVLSLSLLCVDGRGSMISDEIIEKYSDEWMTASEINKLIGVGKSTIFTWSCRNLIRSMPIEGVPKNHTRMKYHVGDCIAKRQNRQTPKPFKRRVVNGITIYRCTKCEQWKQVDGFYGDKHSVHGIHTRCKQCYRAMRNAKGRTAEQKKRYNENEKAQMRRWREMAREATDWNANPVIDAQMVVDLIERVRPHMNDTDICVEARVHIETVRAIRRQASKGRPVNLSTVDKLFTGLQELPAQQELYEYIDKHRPRWHDDHDYCRLCFRTSVAHAARGYCQTCYRNRTNENYKPMVENRWAQRHGCCVRCKQTTSKHAARGLCNACYQYELKRGVLDNYPLDCE